jgi:hypothetical protein
MMILLVPEQGVYEIHKQVDGTIPTIYDAPWPGFTPDLISIASSSFNTGKRKYPDTSENV